MTLDNLPAGEALVRLTGATGVQANFMRAMARQAAAAGPPPALVYRYFDALGCLLYIGKTNPPQAAKREAAHARTARWWQYVASKTVERHGSRRAAHDAERTAIPREQPVFNRVGGGSEQAAREAAYVAARRSCSPP